MLPPVALPFEIGPAEPFTSKQEEPDSRGERWLEEIKRQARSNLENSFGYLRISWSSKYKVPAHPRFEDYTPEEIILETWEQFYFENPKSLELQGIYKRKNKKTGYSYYATGDPLLDKLEEAFGRGETPDLRVLDRKDGKDIFREQVFKHTEHVIGGRAVPGDAVAPRSGNQGVQTTPEGDKVTLSGAKVQHDDYNNSDEWVKEMLDQDPELKALAEKMGHGAK